MSISKLKLFDRTELLKWGNPFLYKGLRIVGWVFGFMHLIFYFILTSLGMIDSATLRILAALMLVSTSFLNLKNEVSLAKKVYIEIVGFVALPLILAYATYANVESAYWYGSSIFFGLIYGFFCYPPITLMLSSLVLVSGFFLPDNGHIQSYFLAQVASIISLCLGITAQLMVRYSHKVVLETKIKGEQLRIMHEHIDELEAREKVISSYVQPSLLTEMAQGYDPSRFNPQEASRAVLFIDMIGYSKMTAETSSTEDLKKCLKILNKYLGEIINSTMAHGGTVDKIMGDAAMCVFSTASQCLAAFESIQEGIRVINQGRIQKGQKPVYFGAGMSYGDVLIANFGNFRKLDRSIIGDEVDVAARLEALTRNYAVDALVSQEFLDALGTKNCDARIMDCVKLKGKSQKIYVYEPFAHEDDVVRQWKKETADRVKEAVDLKTNKNFHESIAAIDSLIAECPKDETGHPIDKSLQLLRDKMEYDAELDFSSWDEPQNNLGLVG